MADSCGGRPRAKGEAGCLQASPDKGDYTYTRVYIYSTSHFPPLHQVRARRPSCATVCSGLRLRSRSQSPNTDGMEPSPVPRTPRSQITRSEPAEAKAGEGDAPASTTITTPRDSVGGHGPLAGRLTEPPGLLKFWIDYDTKYLDNSKDAKTHRKALATLPYGGRYAPASQGAPGNRR